MSSLSLVIPRNLWMSSNRPITNHGQRTRTKDGIHALAALAATGQRLVAHDSPVHVTWTIRYPKGTGWTHGDPANAHPTTKAILDGLVKRAYLPGDGPRDVVSETFTRGPNLEEETKGTHVVHLHLERARSLSERAVDELRNTHGAEPDRYRAVYAERFGL